MSRIITRPSAVLPPIPTISRCRNSTKHGHVLRVPAEFSSKAADDSVWINSNEHLPNGEQVRARLRALLREASYLPDTHNRKWWKTYIISRFREYHNDPINGKSRKLAKISDSKDGDKRLRAVLKDARQAYLLLKSANEGDKYRLLRCLYMSYGRTGKFRRQLLAQLTKQNALSEGSIEELVESLTARRIKLKPQYIAEVFKKTDAFNAGATHEIETTLRLKILPEQLYALARSQISAEPPQLRSHPRSLVPEINDKTGWAKPASAARVKSQIYKFYADLLHRLIPPLPDSLWEDLLLKALGRYEDRNAVPPRRAVPASSNFKQTALEAVASRGKVSSRYLGNGKARVIDKRFMRRLYLEVLQGCPRMTWDAEKKAWTVTWGFAAYGRAIGPLGEKQL